MNFEEIFKEIDLIPGWMGEEDCGVLYKYASQTKGLIVEIGSYMGRSTRLLALSSPESRVITIDSFKMGGKKAKKMLLKNIEGLNVKLVEGTSRNVGKGWKRKIDLLFVDGGHTERVVKKDIELFVPHVKRGGIVLFHDYTTQGPNYGVKKAVLESTKYFGTFWLEDGICCCKI